jgi:hypothetical protein
MKPLLRLPSNLDPQAAPALHRLGMQWAGVKSRLTPTGAPFEWVFTGYDTRPRITYEAMPPAAAVEARLTLVAALLQPQVAVRDRLVSLLCNPSVPIPVWFSGRGVDLAPTKLYVGVAPAALAKAEAWAAEYIGQDYILAACAPQLRMVGYDWQSDRLELYYRLVGFEEWHLPLLLRRFGFGTNAAPLFDCLAECIQRRIENNLPRRVGFSVNVDRQRSGPPVFALHCLACALIGRDTTVRARLLSLATANRWNVEPYAAYTEPLLHLNPVNPYHNIISFIYIPNGEVGIAIGVAPLEDVWHL